MLRKKEYKKEQEIFIRDRKVLIKNQLVTEEQIRYLYVLYYKLSKIYSKLKTLKIVNQNKLDRLNDLIFNAKEIIDRFKILEPVTKDEIISLINNMQYEINIFQLLI